MTHTKESLVAFTERIKEAFIAKKIKAPVHLCSDTQAEPLIEIFKEVKQHDWVFSTWRSSFHALLKGIPEKTVFDEILAGRSMYLMNKEYNFISSSIVGGILPIALGVAYGLKTKLEPTYGKPCSTCTMMTPCRCPMPKVWVFIGDMTATTGLFNEFDRYCKGQGLPVRIVVEDNGLSTDTITDEAWGKKESKTQQSHYNYERTNPHVGVGQRVEF